MSFTLQNQRQTNHLGHESEFNNVNARLNPMTRVMTAMRILRLSVFAVPLLTGVLVYAVVNAAVRGLILILAVVVIVWALLLYQVIRMATACVATNEAVSP